MTTLRPPNHNHHNRHGGADADPFARYRVAEVVSAVVDTCSSCGILICRYGHGIIDGEAQVPVGPNSTLCNDCIRLNYAKRNSPKQTSTRSKHRHRQAAEPKTTNPNAVSRMTITPQVPRASKPVTVAAAVMPAILAISPPTSPTRQHHHHHRGPRTVAAPEVYNDCSICISPMSPRNAPKRAPTKSCTHRTTTCRTCLATHIRYQLSSSSRITCPECSLPLSHSDVKRHADTATFARYDELLTRAAVVGEDSFRWCLRPGCGAGQIHDRGEAEPIVVCYECGGRSCYRHMVVWHENMTCAEYDNGGVPVRRSTREVAVAGRGSRSEVGATRPSRSEVGRREENIGKMVRWAAGAKTKALPPVPERERRNNGDNRSSARSNVETTPSTGRRAAFLASAAEESRRGGSSSNIETTRPTGRRALYIAANRAIREEVEEPPLPPPPPPPQQPQPPRANEKKKAKTVIGVVHPEHTRRGPVSPVSPLSATTNQRTAAKAPKSAVGARERNEQSTAGERSVIRTRNGSEYDRWRSTLDDRIAARAAHPVSNNTTNTNVRPAVRAPPPSAQPPPRTTSRPTQQRIRIVAAPAPQRPTPRRNSGGRVSPLEPDINEPSVIIQRRKREEELTMNMIDGVSKVCPGRNCGWRINKSSGCDHMKCSKCGHQFCYECLADWKEIIRHDNSRHRRGCKYYSPYR